MKYNYLWQIRIGGDKKITKFFYLLVSFNQYFYFLTTFPSSPIFNNTKKNSKVVYQISNASKVLTKKYNLMLCLRQHNLRQKSKF